MVIFIQIDYKSEMCYFMREKCVAEREISYSCLHYGLE